LACKGPSSNYGIADPLGAHALRSATVKNMLARFANNPPASNALFEAREKDGQYEPERCSDARSHNLWLSKSLLDIPLFCPKDLEAIQSLQTREKRPHPGHAQ
jgi:hypothetical protein